MQHLHKRLYIYRLRPKSITTSKITENTVYYRIWHIIEAGHCLFNTANNERERHALVAFINERLRTAHVEACRITTESKRHFSHMPVEKQMALRITGVDIRGAAYGWHLRLEGLLHKISEYENVILYGAGIVGKKTFRILEKANLDDKVLGFAVSDKPLEDKLFGKPIKEISKYEISDNCIVLVTVAESAHDSIIKRVEDCGFKCYYPIDYELETDMDEVLEDGILS